MQALAAIWATNFGVLCQLAPSSSLAAFLGSITATHFSGGIARPSSYPCGEAQPRPIRSSCCSTVSPLSHDLQVQSEADRDDRGVSPRWGSSRTKPRSILSSPAGSRFRYVSLEYPVPKSSIEIRTPI